MKYARFLPLFLFLTFIVCHVPRLFAQDIQHPYDSLKNLLTQTSVEKELALIHFNLCLTLKDTDPKLAAGHGEQAVELYEKADDPGFSGAAINTAIAYSNMGDAQNRDKYINMVIGRTTNATEDAQLYSMLGRAHFGTDSMFMFFDKYFETCLQNNLVDELPNAYSQLGVMSAMKGDYPAADSIWNLGLVSATGPQFDKVKQGILYNLSMLSMQEAQFEKVFEYASEGYELTQRTGNLNTELGFLNMMSKVSSHNLDTLESMRYLKEAYDIIQKNELSSSVASDVVYSLAVFYLGVDSIEEAIASSEELLSMSEVNGRLDDKANAHGVMALASMKGNVRDQAISNVLLSLSDTAALRGQPLENGILQTAATVFHHYEMYQPALAVLGRIEQNLNSKYNLDADRSAAQMKYEVYKALGRDKMALNTLEDFKALSDKHKDLTTTDKLMESKVKFDTERKQLMLDKSEAEVKLLAERNEARNRQMMLGVFGLLSLFGLIYLYRSLKYARNTSQLQAEFSRNLINTQEEERKRVARELHDGVGQKLMLLSKKSHSFGNAEMTELAAETLDEIRTISRDLHPANLEKLGLSSALRSMIDEWDNNTELFFTHEIDDIDESLDTQSSLHLYRIVQESINNIVKHAEAKAALISIIKKENHIEVNVEDNGRGFKVDQGTLAASLGMKTLAERAHMIGADYNIQSQPGKGTTLKLQIPVKHG